MTNPSHNFPGVAVTGMGALCGLGHDLKTVWSSIIDGRSGITRLSNINTENLPINFGGEVKDFTISENLLPAKDQDKYDKFIHYALHAANEAYNQSIANGQHPYAKERVGCILGVGMGGFPLIEQTNLTFINKGARRVTPFFIPSVIPNMSSGLISIKLGIKGTNYSISSACASSSHAITAAAYEIMLGKQDMIITGGAEGVLCNIPISGFASMKALSKRSADPEKASRPFDRDREGFVMGEGAGVLILENLQKARQRGATIYAELVGQGSNSDAHHITAPHPEGIGASQCMVQAIHSAGLSASDIGYVNAHGTSTPLGDIAETKAIKKTFGSHAKNLFISSTKSMTGHLLGAAGGVESIFCIMALHQGILPPTINLDNPDSECDLNYLPHKPFKKQVDYILNNSFGFGGTNSSLIFKRHQG